MDGNDRPWWPQEWQGWTLRTADGDDIGIMVGWFERGPHAGRLRVHRSADGAIAVFAVPLSVIAAASSGTLQLKAGPAEVSEWLAYVVRRHRGGAGVSGAEARQLTSMAPELASLG
jgi:hypothetical protein